jgi:glycosyltransferase involved in cell wall biosynthesis
MEQILTIAIPVFNRSCFFKQSLESALYQSAPTQVIVVDNASTAFDFEAFVNAYQSPRLKYYRNPTNLGAVGNWNRCIDLCATKFLLMLHDDDFLERNHVENFLRVYENGAIIYLAHAGVADKNGQCLRPQAVSNLEAFKEDMTPWCLHNPAYTGSVFDVGKARELGKFRQVLQFTPDWDLWFRLRLSGRAILIPQRGGWYREYADENRGTTQLLKSCKYFFFNRNQIKRNFSMLGRRDLYQKLLHAGEIPVFPISNLINLVPSLHPRMLKYFANTFILAKPPTLSRRALRFSFRIFGWRLFNVLHRLRKILRYELEQQ